MEKLFWTFCKGLFCVFVGCVNFERIYARNEEAPLESLRATATQVIRGVVTDFSSGAPIAYATVSLVDCPTIGTVTDVKGRFVLAGIPIGRHTVQASYVGYEPGLVHEVLVASAKEVQVEIALKERLQELGEVVVRPRVNKEQPLNKMALTGARMLSVEESSRYAGGFDDPARLATSFSGVSTEGATNGISIHGNAPHLLQWRLEDVEIPNPNHFADISVLGGGIFSSLSVLVLGNSDFFTGAFPAEYGNAVSGVFDMKLRNGNDQHHEHTVQVGVGGIDLASEGPLNRNTGSSYIVNYRYSMTGLVNQLGLMDMDGQEMTYQDLNFKLRFPTRHAGTFTTWGTALIDDFLNDNKKPADRVYLSDKTRSNSQQYMGAGGIGHRYFFPKGGLLKSSVAATFFKENVGMDTDEMTPKLVPYMDMYRQFTNLIFTTSYNRKFNAHFTHQSGITYTHMFYDMNMDKAPYYNRPLESVYKGDGSTGLLSAYLSNSWQPLSGWTFNLGLNAQWLRLNDAYTVEPRLGLKWQPTSKSTFSAAYGMHSRMEKTDVYFVHDAATGAYVNKDLDFTKAHHWMLSYAYRISESLNLKVEPYYQILYGVPVEVDGPYSVLNRTEFFLDKALVNKGKGHNYGIDVTLERYLEKGWYGMMTGSLFNSHYSGGDNNWHDTRYNRHFIVNVLGGKEWLLGHNRQNLLSVNLKCTYEGGDRYSPVDEAATLLHPDREVQYDETRAFSLHHEAPLIIHYTVSYRLNKKRVSHEFSIKHINALQAKNYYGHEYNLRTEKIEANEYVFSLPNVSYKLEF